MEDIKAANGGIIKIGNIQVSKHEITCRVSATGAVRKALRRKSVVFTYESNLDISEVPKSVAVIPVLGTLLPVVWVFDADIEAEECDSDFAECIPEIKNGYREMYPSLPMKGSVTIRRTVENRKAGNDRPICLFSGGADAVSMALKHEFERPYLLTVWGADINTRNEKVWNTVEPKARQTASLLDTEFISAKFNFRNVLDFRGLSLKVSDGKDSWWHGFQHGISLLCTAAPAAWIKGSKTVNIASSFTEDSKGKVTCASDPSIDNHICYFGTHAVHNEYNLSRIEKLQHIAEWCKNNQKKIYLRVCASTAAAGNNCCHCEKCWRTILELYSIGEDPVQYGFEYADFGKLIQEIHENAGSLLYHFNTRYIPIIDSMHKHYTEETIREDLKWLYNFDIPADHEIFDWINQRQAYFRDRINTEKKTAENLPLLDLAKIAVKKVL